jgi:hypothetical protein
VALDDQPIKTSRRILLQAMSEERASDFETEAVNATTRRITKIGRDPWQVKHLSGTVAFRRPDAGRLKVTPLDLSGRPAGTAGSAQKFELRPSKVYYLIEP